MRDIGLLGTLRNVSARAPWWRRSDGMPWDDKADAAGRTGAVKRAMDRQMVGKALGCALALALAAVATAIARLWAFAVGCGLVAGLLGAVVWRHRDVLRGPY